MNRLFNGILFISLLFLNPQLRASDLIEKIEPYGTKNDLIKTLAEIADFSNESLTKKIIKLMVMNFAIAREQNPSGPNQSKEFILRHWQIAKERASTVGNAEICLNLLKEGYQFVTYHFDEVVGPDTLPSQNQKEAEENEAVDESFILSRLPGNSPLVAMLAKLINFQQLSHGNICSIISQVPFCCDIDPSLEHDPLLIELQGKYKEKSEDLLISALKCGCPTVRTSITADDLRDYKEKGTVKLKLVFCQNEPENSQEGT
jgi:hypothetical protein